jgi:hypothetical protein
MGFMKMEDGKYETIKDLLSKMGLKYTKEDRMERYPYAGDRSLVLRPKDLTFFHQEIKYSLVFYPDQLRTISIFPEIEDSKYFAYACQHFFFDKKGDPKWVPGFDFGHRGIKDFYQAEKVIHLPPEELIKKAESLLKITLPKKFEGADYIVLGRYDIPGEIGRCTI